MTALPPHTGGWTWPPISEFQGYPLYQELAFSMNIRLRRKQIPNCNLPEVEMNQSFVEKVCAGSLGTTVSQPQAHMPLPFARAAHRAAGWPSAQDTEQSRSHVASAGFAQLRRSPQPALSICVSSRINNEHGGFSIWHC